MFLLAQHAETALRAEQAAALKESFQSDVRALLYAPHTTPGICNFRKGTTKICSEPSVFGTCFCSEHYGEKRKDFIRAFFKKHDLYIPASAPLYPMESVTDRSWETFNQVLTRADGVSCLNTLSLIVYVQHAGDVINLENVKTSFESAGDFLGAEDAASFVNVKEFIAVFEDGRGSLGETRPEGRDGRGSLGETRPEGRDGRGLLGETRPEGRDGRGLLGETRPEGEAPTLYNASVKVWSNNQIQISGCKSVASALRITSAVIRTLQAIGELVRCEITTVKPVFANASFDFFPKQVSLAKMRNRSFLEGLEAELGPAVQVEAGEQRDLFVQYAFKCGAHKTTIKTYHKGNVIITFNNFDGLLLQQSLQAMAKSADMHKIYVQSALQICIEPSPDFFMEPSPRVFSFSPIAPNVRDDSRTLVRGSQSDLRTSKRKFGF
jgi:hypothetical protein